MVDLEHPFVDIDDILGVDPLAEALEEQTCEVCGCVPCDCNQTDQIIPAQGDAHEILTEEEWRCDNVAAIILRKKRSFPDAMRSASLAEVRKYLKAS